MTIGKNQRLKVWNGGKLTRMQSITKKDSFQKCTLENAVASTAALYVINLYVMKKASGKLEVAKEFPAPYYRCEYTAKYYVTQESELPDF